MESKVAEDRLALQKKIQEVHGTDALWQAWIKSCDVCHYWEDGSCRHNLIPLTLNGERCPYYHP